LGGVACGASAEPEKDVPRSEPPSATLEPAQRDELCAALAERDELHRASRSELCIALAATRDGCASDTLAQCERELTVSRTGDCPYNRESALTCSASAADVALCLLDRLEALETARPLVCESFTAPAAPPTCIDTDEACPYLLFPAYKVASWMSSE